MTVQSISKLDAATRQLDMALRLYFEDADLLGILTLAGASHGILRDLVNRSDLAGKPLPGPSVRKLEKEVANAKNFLKHADRDPHNILTFNTEWPDFLIYDAIGLQLRLASRLNDTTMFFLMWVTAKYPFISVLETLIDASRVAELRHRISALGDVEKKSAFLKALNNSQQ
jgi:hypothetical protein